MASNPDFGSIKALSFDIYGTLIDWENGILSTLLPLTSQLPATHSCHPNSATYLDSAIAAFDAHERRIIKANATVMYQDALAEAYLALAEEWGLKASREDAARVPASVADWAPFPDTIEAMKHLGKRFKLIALSNVSNELFAKTRDGLLKDVKFDAVYTAQDIGSYKPDLNNFRYTLKKVKEDFGTEQSELVHVAHGAISDQMPAEELGIGHVWIRRGKHNWPGKDVPNDQRWWETLGDMANDIVS